MTLATPRCVVGAGFIGKTQEREMSTEENMAAVRRLWEELNNKGNLASVDDYYTVDYVLYDAGTPAVRGLDGVGQYFSTLVSAFPDVRGTVEDMVAAGDRVAVRVTLTGTHKAELMGVAPTGRRATWTTMFMGRMANGKYVDTWQAVAYAHLMQQLTAPLSK
jgi:predicted ester cyclase